ncbi:MAG TPA: hypothetical protein EYQ68_06100, partial [Cytophagales bacterium]|nr:hypothetical protein [Cytophagales bacterium]
MPTVYFMWGNLMQALASLVRKQHIARFGAFVDARPTLIAKLELIFEDQGQSFLAETQLGDSWQQALGGLPEHLFSDLDLSRPGVGWQFVVVLERWWMSQEYWEGARVAAEALYRRRLQAAPADDVQNLLLLAHIGSLYDKLDRDERAQFILMKAFKGLEQQLDEDDARLAVV